MTKSGDSITKTGRNIPATKYVKRIFCSFDEILNRAMAKELIMVKVIPRKRVKKAIISVFLARIGKLIRFHAVA
jgi:hypothetical protein